VSGERLIRLLALIFLCGLVYYFSFDHGRTTERIRSRRLEAENESLRAQLTLQTKELEDLKKRIVTSSVEKQESSKPVQLPSENHQRITLKTSENKLLFNDRLLLTLVDFNALDKEIVVRLHFLESDLRETSIMGPGDSLKIEVDGRPYRLIFESLKGSLAFFVILENSP